MPTPTKGPRLGGSPTHERLMLNNLSAQLFQHKRITTTLTKAKRLRPVAERFITFGKKGDLAARRRVLRSITDKSVVHELFTVIAPAMAERPGGYTRILRVGTRRGDGVTMALIELVWTPDDQSPRSVRGLFLCYAGPHDPHPDHRARPGRQRPAALADALGTEVRGGSCPPGRPGATDLRSMERPASGSR